MFNHTMVYDGFRSEDLREACVEITVWDHDRLNSQFIGGLRLGLGTGETQFYLLSNMSSLEGKTNIIILMKQILTKDTITMCILTVSQQFPTKN